MPPHGLYPGGKPPNQLGEFVRRHLHFSTSLEAAVGVLPDNFRRRGIDCAVHLDASLMLADGIDIYLSSSGAVLAPTQVG